MDGSDQAESQDPQVEHAHWAAHFLLELIDEWSGLWPHIRFEDRHGKPAASIMDVRVARFMGAILEGPGQVADGRIEVRLTLGSPKVPGHGFMESSSLGVWWHGMRPGVGSSGSVIKLPNRPTLAQVVVPAVRMWSERNRAPRSAPVPMVARLRNVAAAERELAELREPWRVGSPSLAALARTDPDVVKAWLEVHPPLSDDERAERIRRARSRHTMFLLLGGPAGPEGPTGQGSEGPA